MAVPHIDMNIRSQHTSGLLTRIVRGTAWSLLAGVATAVTSFIVTPFTLRLFGPEQYGIWAILTTIVAYFGFADLGMGTASTRFASDAHSKSNYENEADVVWTSLLVGFVSASLLAAGLALFAARIARALVHGPPHLELQATLGLRIAGLVFLGYVLSNILNTAQLVRLRLGLFSSINTGAAILQITLVPIVLKMSGGLVGAVWAVAAVAMSSAIVHGLVSGWIFPGVWSGKIRVALIRPLLAFGAPLVFSYFAEMALVASDKLVLARVMGPRAVAHYAVAASFAALLGVIPQALGRAMLPAFGRFLANHETDALNTFYARAIRGNIFWLAPALLACWIICRPFLSWWAGAEYGAESSIPAYVLLVGCAFDALSILPARLLWAAGQTKAVAWIYAVQALPFLGCAFLMAQSYGVIGVALVWSVRALVNLGLLFAKAHSIAKCPASPLTGRHLIFLLALLPLLAVFAIATRYNIAVAARLLAVSASLGVYIAIVGTKILSADERHWFSAAISGSIKQ